MQCPLLIVSQSDYLIQTGDTNSNTEWQTVHSQISWLVWIYTVCKGLANPGPAGPGLILSSAVVTVPAIIHCYIRNSCISMSMCSTKAWVSADLNLVDNQIRVFIWSHILEWQVIFFFSCSIIKWASAWQSLHNGMCTQRRLIRPV